MTQPETTIGYCPMCMQNIEHSRVFSSGMFRVMDASTFQVCKIFRLGPWHCYQCERKSIYLRRPDRGAPTFHTKLARSEFTETVSEEPGVDEPIGNFLKTDHSLVMRDKRTKRFSQKFRESAVERLLSNATSISQLRQELEVGESDIVDWIAEFVSRKRDQIEQLTRFIALMQETFPGQVQHVLDSVEIVEQVSSDDVVDGKILPK